MPTSREEARAIRDRRSAVHDRRSGVGSPYSEAPAQVQWQGAQTTGMPRVCPRFRGRSLTTLLVAAPDRNLNRGAASPSCQDAILVLAHACHSVREPEPGGAQERYEGECCDVDDHPMSVVVGRVVAGEFGQTIIRMPLSSGMAVAQRQWLRTRPAQSDDLCAGLR